jgi:UDP-3-O-[3-hydroxymyristoyl] glucosamine N-acyltransferase
MMIDQFTRTDRRFEQIYIDDLTGITIGKGTTIGQHCVFGDDTEIGEDCRIDPFVCSSGSNYIGDGVTLRYGVILARGVNIGSDCYLCPRVMTEAQNHRAQLIGGAAIGPRCFIGTHSVIAAGIEIAPGTTIGAMSYVNRSIVEPGVYVGSPARRIR